MGVYLHVVWVYKTVGHGVCSGKGIHLAGLDELLELPENPTRFISCAKSNAVISS